MAKDNQKELFAFILMPIRPETEDVYRLGIQEAAKEAKNIRAERLDDQFYDEGMLDRIHRQIEIADIIIADLTEKNPNVFYELGYAHANQKLCLNITKEAENIPFDLKHKPHIVYSNVTDLKTKLIKHLQWAKEEIHSANSTPFQIIQNNIFGYLEKDYYHATANINFDFVLKSNCSKTIHIEAVYFYTGNSYTVKMDEKSCHQAKSDIDNFTYSYYLETNKTLPPEGWLPLKFSVSRILANAWEVELKDEYFVGGPVLFKFNTDSGIFLHKLALTINLKEIPF